MHAFASQLHALAYSSLVRCSACSLASFSSSALAVALRLNTPHAQKVGVGQSGGAHVVLHRCCMGGLPVAWHHSFEVPSCTLRHWLSATWLGLELGLG